ncbi:hypothetical protein AB9M92_07475 [Peribacillus frigoritolerans]|uniref:hypothetical protein n=1 Tax=Peribacillus frigoritolerans TaxID=450367 RepID=UPI003515D379
MDKWVKVLVYRFVTPKLDPKNGTYIEERFDKEHLIPFLKKVRALHLTDRIYDSNGKVMTLESFSVSADADFYEGYFTAARYGEINNLVNRRTFKKRKSDKTLDEGDENNVHFVIELATGRLFLQSDGKRLVTKKSIDVYLSHFISYFESDIARINKEIYPLMMTNLIFSKFKRLVTSRS